MESFEVQIRKPLHQEFIGVSVAMEEVKDLMARVAPSDLTVLITGETGTGKDLAARLLHGSSRRSKQRFVKVNCPSIQETLFESELYGHEKGAFTGAISSRPGWLESAHEGTLFLDEISETVPGVQNKFLLALDGEPFLRVGGVRPVHSDVRIMAATNVPLDELVVSGKLSEEALFRLAEVVVQLPPLRHRPEDIAIIAEHFNYNFCMQHGQTYMPIPASLVKKMETLTWRGNVRELAGNVKEYLISGLPESLTRFRGKPRPSTEEASPEHALVPLKKAVQRAVEKTERALIQEALEYTLWNRRKAAKLLKISYSSLLRRMDAYRIGKT